MASGARERRPSTSAPISDLQGPVGPGFSRPKHKRTFTGFGAGEIKSVEGMFFPFIMLLFPLRATLSLCCFPAGCAVTIFRRRGKLITRDLQLRSMNPNAKHGRNSRPKALRTQMISRRRLYDMSRRRSLVACSIATRQRPMPLRVWRSETG